MHIGGNADVEKEMAGFTTGIFNPTNVDIHSQDVHMFGDTGIVITDVDYGLLLDGQETTHHFTTTEVFKLYDDEWKLIQFTFTALVI